MTKFSVGDRIDYFYGDDWCEGVIHKINADSKSYCIHFDDGDTFDEALETDIKLLKSAKSSTEAQLEQSDVKAASKYQIGDRIEYPFDDGMYSGFVKEVNANNKSYSILFDDGEFLSDAREKDMKLLDTAENTPRQYIPKFAASKFQVGQRVERLFGSEWYPGEITAINSDGNTYAVNFDDGEVMDDAEENELKSIKPAQDAAHTVSQEKNHVHDEQPKKQRDASLEYIPKYGVGDRVKYVMDGEWYEGYVKKINHDGRTYCIEFDDGDYYEDCEESDVKTMKMSPNKATHSQESRNIFGNEIFQGPQESDMDAYITDNTNSNSKEAYLAKSRPNPEAIAHIIKQVEHFLLPSHDERYWAIREKESETDVFSGPINRLENILFELSVADHIRLMQSLYRDTEDDQQLEPDLRFGNDNDRLPTKILMNRITEGKVRALALCRLCYPEDSIEVLRAIVDLANSYASQGMWAQVAEHVESASQRLTVIISARKTAEFEATLCRANHAAARVACVFRVLRDHAMRAFGEVQYTVVKEISKAIEKLDQSREPETEGEIHDVEYIGEAIQFTTLLHDYFEQFNTEESMRSNRDPQSWGDFVDFLRRDCPVMTTWIMEMNSCTLPQNKAVLRLAFHLADVQKRGVAHPSHLAGYFSRFPALAKLCCGSDLADTLSKTSTEVPIYVSTEEGNVRILGNSPQGNRVDYELPVTWEEVYAMMISENNTDTLALLRIQIQTMSGVCNVFANKLQAAELNMREALKTIESNSLEMEVPACELYNSIAQMMIMKHRQWHTKKKNKMRDEMERHLETDDGQLELQEEAKMIRRKSKENGHVLSRDQSEYKARNNLIKAGIKALSEEIDPTTPSLVAAFRYLIMSHQIVERVHGELHACVGAACLAVASVQNVSGELDDARDWLVKALYIMERLNPPPVRAIAFVQVQLSQILSKQNHAIQSMEVLRAASTFHIGAAEEAILKENMYDRGKIPQPLSVGHPGLEDVKTALNLMEKLLISLSEQSLEEEAITCSEKMADLAERAFGWYSKEAALSRKELGLRYVKVEDWRGACANFKKSVEAHELCFGDKDIRTLDVSKQLLVATSHYNAFKFENIQQNDF